ncbi:MULTISPECIES: hypothetical protein [Ramlibacter]|uniref:Lipoprotein n=1 Tax=Ramlibacter pinisoli TaxID=2682844 RepID=A0A6N8IQ18_9BURK|nr:MULTISPECIES: hypothetical protein [Ramlibacter]MBA2963962.1 hypothetical protein [Ramlibacter sp. CGMCC 1.13660]MVQ28928.1 hypothetical protein [Ramlibacter pinisoli]
MTVPGRFTPLLAAGIALLAGCAYAPVQSSFQFDRHPGVFMETRWQYGYGYDYLATYVVNRSTVDKCVWTQRLDSRVLRPNESWLVSEVQSPGSIGVANVVPSDPNCLKAKSSFGGP